MRGERQFQVALGPPRKATLGAQRARRLDRADRQADAFVDVELDGGEKRGEDYLPGLDLVKETGVCAVAGSAERRGEIGVPGFGGGAGGFVEVGRGHAHQRAAGVIRPIAVEARIVDHRFDPVEPAHRNRLLAEKPCIGQAGVARRQQPRQRLGAVAALVGPVGDDLPACVIL